MRELHRQCLEGVSLRDMIFDSSLEFFVSEGLPRNTFEFVVSKCGRQKVRQLRIVTGPDMLIVKSQRGHLVS